MYNTFKPSYHSITQDNEQLLVTLQNLSRWRKIWWS